MGGVTYTPLPYTGLHAYGTFIGGGPPTPQPTTHIPHPGSLTLSLIANTHSSAITYRTRATRAVAIFGGNLWSFIYIIITTPQVASAEDLVGG